MNTIRKTFRISKPWKRTLWKILDIVFPTTCRHCGKIKSLGPFPYICIDCSYIEEPENMCKRCGSPQHYNLSICSICKSYRRFYIDEICYIGIYKGPLKTMLSLYKFDKIKAYADIFAKILHEKMLLKGWDIDAVAYIPMTGKERRSRGFNQSRYLAFKISKLLNKPVEDYLIKVKETLPQRELNRKERLKNIKGAFALSTVKPQKKVLLIDDVMTTGATLNEAARILKKGGAKEVYASFIARD